MELGYRRELDGIRGIAILAVLAFHTSLFWARGLRRMGIGVLGVDMFFVLSGFLITSLLVGENVRTGRVSRRNFYVRRALRLGPALVITLGLGGLIVQATAGLPKLHWLMDNAIPYSRSTLIALLFAGNWFGNRLGILGHTWSLGLEEQFYFAWPLVLVIALRKRVRLQSLALGLTVAALGIAVMRWGFDRGGPGAPHTAAWNVAQPFGRADGVLLGSALACVLASKAGAHVSEILRERRLVAAMFVLAAATLVGALNGVHALATSMLTVLDISFAVLVGHVVCDPSSPVARALRTQPLAAIGRMSYGLYLYHVPLFYFAFMTVRGWHGALFGWGISLGAATVSFVLIESPVLKLKRRFAARAKPRVVSRQPGRQRVVDIPAAA
jgi:peptidoglycan/LPS O-acetylase OafA/YrhL